MSGLRTAGFLLVCSSAIHFFAYPVADNDLWGHVFFGREMLSSGTLPAWNQYSYTAPAHPWINHEILAECAFAALFDTFGAPGLVTLKLSVGLATLMVMARTAGRRSSEPLAHTAALVLGASLMGFGFMVRPQIFSFFAMAVLWDRLHAHAAGDPLGIWGIPILFAVWINTHGGVLAGEAVLLVFTVLHAAREPRRRRRLQLLAVTGVATLALLLNPYGIRLVAFLARDVLRERPITEWAGIALFDRSNIHFKFAVLACGAWMLVRGRGRLWESATIAAFAIATFRHERHMPLFSIVVTPALAELFADAARRLRSRAGGASLSKPARMLVTAGIAAIAAFQITRAAELHRALGYQILVSPDQFPVDAVRFLKRNHLTGNLALPFGWGEYAIWHLYPGCRVSIDGRYTTAYPEPVIDDGWRFIDGGPGWDRPLANASLALVDRQHATAERLFRSPAWRNIYSDQTALVFVREGVALPPTLDRRQRLQPEGAFTFP